MAVTVARARRVLLLVVALLFTVEGFCQGIPTEFTIGTPHGKEKIQMTVLSEGMVGGRWEIREREIILSCLTANSIVLDVGAHCGIYTIPLAKYLQPHGKVYAFEPSSANYETLVENVRRNNCHNVEALKLAVGDRTTTAVFWIDRKNTRDSLAIGATSPKTSETVNVCPLDSLFESTSVTLMKVDIQGAEAMALRGAKHLIERCHPYILIEFWPHGLRAFGESPGLFLGDMRGMGYELLWCRSRKEWKPATDTEILKACAGSQWVNLLLRPLR